MHASLTFNDLTASEKKALLHQIKVEWTHASTAIEGNTLSLGETQFIIEHGLTVKGKSIREHNEVIGHARAIDLVYAMLDKERVTQEDLFLLHKAVMTERVIDIYAPIGAWKVEDNGRYVAVGERSEYIPYARADDTAYLMGLWLEYFNAHLEVPDFNKALGVYTDLHLAFGAIHPFFDGNGRMARLLATIPLIKNGWLPLVVSQERRQEYIQVLSNYSLVTKPLNATTTKLIEYNEAYDDILKFFADEYRNIRELFEKILEVRK